MTGDGGAAIGNPSKVKATRNDRLPLSDRGLARFEVVTLTGDRDLVRSLARRLTKQGPEADQLRRTVKATVESGSPRPGSILSALRRSPLVGAELDKSRPREQGRRADL